MRNLSLAVLFGLFTAVGAQASQGRIVVSCEKTGFSDLLKIEIQETDLKGQYVMIETTRDFAKKENVTRYTTVFGYAEIEKSEFPELTPWNGYTRNLIRYGRDNYSILFKDECSGGSTTISCKESF